MLLILERERERDISLPCRVMVLLMLTSAEDVSWCEVDMHQATKTR